MTITLPDDPALQHLDEAQVRLDLAGGQKEVQRKKLGFTALKIEVDRGTGQFVYLATDTEPHYIDTVTLPPGTAAVWRYRAIYLEGDQVFGQWSDVVSLAVNG